MEIGGFLIVVLICMGIGLRKISTTQAGKNVITFMCLGFAIFMLVNLSYQLFKPTSSDLQKQLDEWDKVISDAETTAENYKYINSDSLVLDNTETVDSKSLEEFEIGTYYNKAYKAFNSGNIQGMYEELNKLKTKYPAENTSTFIYENYSTIPLIEASDFINKYELNSVNADLLYKDQLIIIHGVVQSIDTVWEQPYVSISSNTGDSYSRIDCKFDDEKENLKIANLSKGDEVFILGIGDGKAIFNPRIEKSYIINSTIENMESNIGFIAPVIALNGMLYEDEYISISFVKTERKKQYPANSDACTSIILRVCNKTNYDMIIRCKSFSINYKKYTDITGSYKISPLDIESLDFFKDQELPLHGKRRLSGEFGIHIGIPDERLDYKATFANIDVE